jgi:hypothetical protein
MREQSTDPRPQHDAFARFLAAFATQGTPPHTIEGWLRSWSDQQSEWTNLRNVGHWIERSRS